MSTSNRPHYIFLTQSQSLAEYITQYIKKTIVREVRYSFNGNSLHSYCKISICGQGNLRSTYRVIVVHDFILVVNCCVFCFFQPTYSGVILPGKKTENNNNYYSILLF